MALAGAFRGVSFLVGLAVATAEEPAAASPWGQAPPRQLADGRSWAIVNERSTASDGTGYFVDSSSYNFGTGAVTAEQWRLNRRVWRGSATLTGNTNGMAGDCAPYTCNARVSGSGTTWKVGDVLVIGWQLGTAAPTVSQEEKDADKNAMIMFIILLVLVVLGTGACIGLLHRQLQHQHRKKNFSQEEVGGEAGQAPASTAA
mmetsp:Transcript_89481/g.283218  ORF Transcript_89481/g.283218 Transcript_89481/m.283218 type:complete len:202 (-) Transcript_89481:529-1134(-)